MIADPLLHVVAPFTIGAAGAVINVIAGGGGVLTIPLLMEMGLSAEIANATNRLGVWTQSVTGATGFARRRLVPWILVRRLLPATLVGLVSGIWLAARLDAAAVQRGILVFFLLMACVLAWDIAREGRGEPPPPPVPDDTPPPRWMHVGAMGAGFIGGFIQAGVGIFILLVLHVLGRHDVVRSNGAKNVLTLLFATLSVVALGAAGRIVWSAAVFLSLGAMAGAWIGVRLATRIRASTMKRVLLVAVLASAGRLGGWW